MLTIITNLDITITNWIFTLPHPTILNYFFGFFAIKGVYILIWTSIFIYLIVFEGKKHKTFIIYFLASLIIAALSVRVIKNITVRPRPFATNYYQLKPIQPTPTNYPAHYSFPSGHATISFAAAIILSAFDKKRKKYFYIIASLIAFSRVYLGYHYVADVIAGTLLGWLISYNLLLKLIQIQSGLKRQNEKIKTTM